MIRLVLATAATIAVAAAVTAPPKQIADALLTEVFIGGEGAYHTYRIPSAIVTPNGTLLAFAEGRKADAADAGDIDLVLRRSRDGGRT
jgi:sialidase-1